MECFSCSLRYNSESRQPIILTCGHSICSQCLPSQQKCKQCNLEIDSERSNLNYSLLEIIGKDKRIIDKFIKVCFIGGSGFGKTSIIRALTQEPFFQQVATTIGYDFTFRDREINEFMIRYQLWDSAGQQRYQAISPIHYKNADVIIIVYDVSKDSNNNKITYWLEESQRHCPESTIRILVGNKTDMLDNSIYKPLQQSVWMQIKEGKLTHIQVSCKLHSGIDLLWQKLQSAFFSIRKKGQLNPEKNKNSQLKNEQKKPLKKKNKRKKQIKQIDNYSCC